MVPEYRRQMPSFRHSIPIGMIFVKLTNAMIENTYNNKMMMLMMAIGGDLTAAEIGKRQRKIVLRIIIIYIYIYTDT